MRDQPIVKDLPTLKYGEQPGLRFACVLDGRGGCYDLSWPDVAEWTPDQGVLWIHLERDDEHAQKWIREQAGIDPVIAEGLLAEETRPRVDDYDDALLVILRGVNRGDEHRILDLVPIHLWIDANRVISLRDRDHFLTSLRRIREALVAGRGPKTAGGVFTRITAKLVQHLEPVVLELEDDIDQLDKTLFEIKSDECRRALGAIRRESIELRRFLAPQREALFRLQIEDATWLSKRDKIRLREGTDRLLRYLENLDSIRDRATILHEDLAAQTAEQQARASNRLTTIAALLLPPSLVAGMLGSNLEGIPFHDHPWAFAIAALIIVALFPLEIWLLRRLKWL